MRLADFILGKHRTHSRGMGSLCARHLARRGNGPATLCDHAEEILRATALDMKSDQTAAQQSDKSKGAASRRPWDRGSMNAASVMHAVARVGVGFELGAVIAEYRALGPVSSGVWRDSAPDTGPVRPG